MKRFFIGKINALMLLCLALAFAEGGVLVGASVVYGAQQQGKACHHCGMDLDTYAKSRMQVVFTDGTVVDVCSIHCTAAEIKQNKDKQVKSITVADYATGNMIDATTAIWVIGGKKEGVMTSVAKWAFSGKVEAENFVKDNSGEVADFDRVMAAAKEEVEKEAAHGEGHGHMDHMGHDMGHMHHMDMGAGSQMTYNPAFGDDIYHLHPQGMWMLTYKFMHMDMNGMRDGTSNVPVSKVSDTKGYNYMDTPTNMRMDMQMLMLMYGVTDKLTLMAMGNYVTNRMNMLMNMHMGKGNSSMSPMITSGVGDTEVRGIYAITKDLNGSLGLSLPTGSINQSVDIMGNVRAPYDMQLGSGTFDLKPALTYSGLSGDALWNWGAQAMYAWHMGKNEYHYSLGDSFKLTGWLQRALGPVTPWVRLAFSDTGRIKGADPEIATINNTALHSSWHAGDPGADPANYGGQRLDTLLGVSFAKGPFSFGVEGGIPVYQRLNGLQMKTDWLITAAVQVMF